MDEVVCRKDSAIVKRRGASEIARVQAPHEFSRAGTFLGELGEQLSSRLGREVSGIDCVPRIEAGDFGLAVDVTPTLRAGLAVTNLVSHTFDAPAIGGRSLAYELEPLPTLGLAYGLKRFRDLGMNPSEIRLTGGGSQSAAWRQIAADAFGVPTVTLSTAEGTTLVPLPVQALDADAAPGAEVDEQIEWSGAEG